MRHSQSFPSHKSCVYWPARGDGHWSVKPALPATYGRRAVGRECNGPGAPVREHIAAWVGLGWAGLCNTPTYSDTHCTRAGSRPNQRGRRPAEGCDRAACRSKSTNASVQAARGARGREAWRRQRRHGNPHAPFCGARSQEGRAGPAYAPDSLRGSATTCRGSMLVYGPTIYSRIQSPFSKRRMTDPYSWVRMSGPCLSPRTTIKKNVHIQFAQKTKRKINACDSR